jgi:hypothetical protein
MAYNFFMVLRLGLIDIHGSMVDGAGLTLSAGRKFSFE